MQFGFFEIWRRIFETLGIIHNIPQRKFLRENRVSHSRIKPPEFDGFKQVRVMLFRELNGQERRLLFDSKAVRKKDPSTSPNEKTEKPPLYLASRRNKESSIEKSFKLNDGKSKDFVYEWQKSSSDEQMLREMIFGSVSISYQGTMLKVHTIKSPLQIMLSLVFPAPQVPMFRIGGQELEESGTWNTSTKEINVVKSSEKTDTHLAHSVPVNVPSRLSEPFGESRDSDTDSLQSHDGYSSLPAVHLSPETSTKCLPRSSSYNSLQRRLLRNKATSIEFGLQKPEESTNPEEYSRTPGQRRVKLGLSIVINLPEDNKQEEMQFNDFLFTHMSLIEGHMLNLKETVIRAYLNRRNFVHLMFEGSKKFQQAIHDLYTSPRLQNPEWLSIISSPNHRFLSYSFLDKFINLLKLYDKKETNFFVSTLLTAVLTHHLAWVPSVIPTDSKIQPSSNSHKSHKYTPYWVDLLSKSRPYNPHWVQLSDLYGALGFPLKLAKTVVKGHKREIILKFLQVLSYFIRCSDICEKTYEKTNISFDLENFPCQSSSKTKDSSSDNLISSILEMSESSSTVQSDSSTVPCVSKTTLAENKTLSSTSDFLTKVTSAPSKEKITSSSLKQDVSETIPSILEKTTNISTDSASGLDSLGYISLEGKSEELRKLESSQPTSSEDLINAAIPDSSYIVTKGELENTPIISITKCADSCDNNDDQCLTSSCSYACKSQKCAHSCVCDTCPCNDNQGDATVKGESDSPKTKECESVEEGYHSMEEPHSPSREKLHLSEMLKRFKNWRPEGLEEMPMPEVHCSGENSNSTYYKSFGWSLLAEITDHYLMDFSLQGLLGPAPQEEIRQDLIQSTQIPILGEPVSEAVCIIADTDKWCVELLSSNYIGNEIPDSLGMRVTMSSLVSGICDAILNMHELGIASESCIIYLEDQLQELYFRSQVLSDYLRNNRSAIPLFKVASVLNVDLSDMPLLFSIASTHTPYLSVHSR